MVAVFQMAADLGAIVGPLVAGWLTDVASYQVGVRGERRRPRSRVRGHRLAIPRTVPVPAACRPRLTLRNARVRTPRTQIRQNG